MGYLKRATIPGRRPLSSPAFELRHLSALLTLVMLHAWNMHSDFFDATLCLSPPQCMRVSYILHAFK